MGTLYLAFRHPVFSDEISQTNEAFLKEGNSDKVYEVDLCEVGPDQYVVNFRYGRRGATLKDGTKTTTPLKQKAAEDLFDAMEAEKRKKGYQSEAEMFQPLPEVTIDKNAPTSRESAILQRLKAAAEGQPDAFRTVWKTSRVMWAAGELRLKEAVPFIIRLVDRGDEMQRYAALWALGRIADPVAARTLQVYFSNQKYTEKTRRVAGEGLLHVLQGEERQSHLNHYASRLPEAIRQAVQTENAATLQALLRDRVLAQTHPDYAYLEDLYALSIAAPSIKRALLPILREVPLRPNYFRHLRHLYKLAELRDDYETLGLLAYRMEKTPEMFHKPVRHYWEEEDTWANKSRFIPALNERIKVKPELRKPDSRLAYSDKTRAYFKRKVFRSLRELGQAQSLDYVKMAMGLLLAYDKAVDFQQPYSVTEWKYVQGQNGRNWEHRQYQIYFPAYAKALLLNQILYGKSPRLELINQNIWQVKEPVVVNRSGRNQPEPPPTSEQQSSGVLASLLSRIGNLFAGDTKQEPVPVFSQPTETPEPSVPAREEPYPELWDRMPQAYVQLLLQARVDEIHAFALNNLKKHPDYEAIEKRLDLKMLQILLASEFQVPAFFGLEVARKRLSQQADVPLILALLNSTLKEARTLGMEYAGKNLGAYFQDTELITQLLLSPYEDVRKWTGQILTKANLSGEQANLVIGRVIAAIMGWQENTEAVNKIISDATRFLLNQYPQAFQALSMSVVGDLLRVPVEATQVFAGKLLIVKSATGPLPAEILIAFILSPFPQVRQVAAELLDTQQARFRHDPAFATRLANQLVPLTHKETYEGLHQDVAQLLSNQLVNYLSFVDRTLALQLVYANYRPAQDFGLVLLDKYIRPDDLTIRQVIALGNHEILAFRQWCLAFFERHLARIRFEREESIRLLDAKWDDTRAFALAFFRDKFSAEDWTPETLIAIVDTVRPDIQAFGRELIGRFFEEADGAEYLLKLSQHPGVSVQLFATNFLERYASDQPERLYALETFFRSVLTRVNKARVAKDRIYQFLQTEGLKSEENARFVARIVADVSATVAIGDKARCIQLMQALSKQYEGLNLPIQYIAIEERVE